MSEAKQYLERIKLLDVMIDSKLEELAQLDSLVMRITPTMNATGAAGGSGNQDKLGEAVAKIVDLQKEINWDIDEFINLKREALYLLKKMKNPDFYKVLHKRYVLYESFAKIAADMNLKTERSASRMNGRALQAFDRVMKPDAKENTIPGHTTSNCWRKA